MFGKKKIDIDIDNILIDKEIREIPLRNKVFGIVTILFFLLIFFVLFKVFFLYLNKEKYSLLAHSNNSSFIEHKGERGLIFDRFGKPLVENQLVYRAVLFTSPIRTLPKGEKEKVMEKLEKLFSFSKQELSKKMSFFKVELGKNLSVSQASQIENEKIPGLFLEKDFKRIYPYKELAHIIGYLGSHSSHLVGQAGLEEFYENYLKGKNGKKLIIGNAQGQLLGEKILTLPQKGKDVYTFIDLDFQKYVYQRLSKRLKELGLKKGLAVAVNPENGEVLSMVSLPCFDPNNISSYLYQHNHPLFNRALSGVYLPGSVIKPLEAIAGLKEKLISSNDYIFCPGYLEIFNPYTEKFTTFKDWKPHDHVNLYKAIAASCNVYFYRLGGGHKQFKGLGRQRIISYFEKFRLNKKTEIDLSSESQGKVIPKQPWRLGDTYNLSIGQGQMLVTPLGMLSYISSIANRGKFVRFRIAKNQPFKILSSLEDIGENIFKEVEKGMFETVEKEYGTAHSICPLSFKLAAKTGTPQTGGGKTNAIFAGYIPKKLAILILIEESHEGALNTLPVAKDVLFWYWENRIKNDYSN